LHLLRLATSLDRRRFEPLVVSLAPPGPVTDLLQQRGITTQSCRATHALNLAALWRLRRIMACFKPDLVHAMLFHANLATRLVCPSAGVPRTRLINEIQTVEIERTWHLVLDQLTYPWCALEIGNSPAVVEHLVDRAAIPREHLVCIPGGAETLEFENPAPANRSLWNIPQDAKLLIWVGRMDPVKRIGDLLQAMTLLPDDTRTHLLLVGDGPERPRVESHVAAAGLRERVHLAGFRRDVPALLAAADLFVLPSLTEGMPNALLEAMACGLPVVTCDVPGCRDLINHLADGLLVAPAQPQALARALAHLLSDSALAARLGARARAKIRREYTSSACLAKYLKLYEDLLAKT
jgi:starch synthase (maltosyl-transferring)